MLDRSCQVNRALLVEPPGDCYDTPPVAVHALLKIERLPHRIWEPCCGTGNIVNVLRAAGHEVIATDLNDRGCPDSQSGIDFLLLGGPRIDCGAIVTNAPFSLAEEFVAVALERAPLVVMLLRLAFYESERRSEILERRGLARVHCFAKRLPMMHRAGWEGRKASSGMAFAWFVWERGYNGRRRSTASIGARCDAMLDRPPRRLQEARQARQRARQARYARRQRAGLGIYAVEVSPAVLDALVAFGWLKECDTGDRVLVGINSWHRARELGLYFETATFERGNAFGVASMLELQ
jgi:hypothetical protein